MGDGDGDGGTGREMGLYRIVVGARMVGAGGGGV